MIKMICVSIANSNIEDMFKNSKKAIGLGANYIEIRVDYLENLSLKSLNGLAKIISLPVPIILTCRKKDEGGKASLDENSRLEILDALINFKPSYLDLEYNMDKNILNSLIKKCHENGVKVILSYHDFKGTPEPSKANSIINSMKNLNPNVIKVIFTANTIYDNNTIFEILKNHTNEDLEIVSFCMGDKGIISRVLSPFYGALFTFASLDIQTAPGQISLIEMLKIHEIIEKYIC